MSEPVEPYALARRGLPLPVTRRTTLPGSWLPAAVRNGHSSERTPPRVPSTPPVAPEETGGDEPWWIEASELVPVAPALAPMMSPVAAVQNVAVPADSEVTPVGVSVRHVVDVAAPHVDHSGPTQTTVPAGSPAAAPPERAMDGAAGGIPLSFARASSADISPPPAPHIGAPALEALTGDAGEPRVGNPGLRSHIPTPPAIRVLSFGVAAAVPTPAANASERSVRVTTLAVSHHSSDLESAQVIHSVRSETLEETRLTVVESMGLPASSTPDPAPSPVDLTPLLAPPRPRRDEVHIGRVAVTVQAPVGRATAAPTAPPASAPAAAAAPARSYRNPWASYYTRAD